MISNPLFIIVILIAIETLILKLSRHKRTERFFNLLPAVFWIYFLPMLASTFGLITRESPVYGMITIWLLPASLVLLLLPVDIRAILRLGPAALAMFFIGAAGIMAGAVISFNLFKPLIGNNFWSGFGALSASWTGGSANMIAVKEALSVQDAVFAPMVIVDTVVPYLWMGIVIAMAGMQKAFDRWNRADHAILERLGKCAAESSAASGNQRTPSGIFLTLTIAFAGSGAAYLIARQMTQIISIVNIYTWTIIIVSMIGVMLSLTPAHNLERLGATRTGYNLLYFVLTAIGARASITGIGSTFVLITAGMLIVAIHALVLLAGARLIRAPMFLIAAASQANIGGVASAPVVAEVYQPGLASVGLLLAILGNIFGTWLGIFCAHLCRIM